jgi:hypothetical protein
LLPGSSHTAWSSRPRMTGIRSWISCTSSLASVTTMLQDSMVSPVLGVAMDYSL